MSTDVVATDEQVNRALRAMMMHLEATGLAEGYDSLSHALHELDMWDFMYNQARVVAQLQAFNVRDTAIINKLTMAGAYVQLEGVTDE